MVDSISQNLPRSFLIIQTITTIIIITITIIVIIIIVIILIILIVIIMMAPDAHHLEPWTGLSILLSIGFQSCS